MLRNPLNRGNDYGNFRNNLKTVDFDIDADDILEMIFKRSPKLALLLAGVFVLGGIAFIVFFFKEYMQT